MLIRKVGKEGGFIDRFDCMLGRNSIIVILGANLLLKEEDLQKAEETIQQSEVVVCQLEIRQETVAKTFEIARKHSGKEFPWFPRGEFLLIKN